MSKKTTISDKKVILLTAGGTGGHLFPAESLARHLHAQGHKIIFVTDKRGVKFQTLDDVATVLSIPSATMGAGILSKVKALFTILLGVTRAFGVLWKYKPDTIIGFGGYPSFPSVFAGQCFRIPTIIHEQNGVLGKANKFLSKKATKIAASLENTKSIAKAFMQKTIVTGNPVRPAVLELKDYIYQPPEKEGEINIFIMGGSQGARILSSIIPQAMALLPDDLKSRIHIVQQCREEDLKTAQDLYNAAQLPDQVELATFFNNVSEKLKDCHLFIGRSGASTVAEIACIGCPAIFIPLRVHADQQQKINAETLSNVDGALILTEDKLTPETLATQVKDLLYNPDKLNQLAKSSKKCGKPDATEKLADLVIKTAHI